MERISGDSRNLYGNNRKPSGVMKQICGDWTNFDIITQSKKILANYRNQYGRRENVKKRKISQKSISYSKIIENEQREYKTTTERSGYDTTSCLFA